MSQRSHYLHIQGGTVYDPARGVSGEIQDIWIAHGKVTAPPSEQQAPSKTLINAQGMVVMPGGVDMHCHIAGTKVHSGRLLQSWERGQHAVSAYSDMVTGHYFRSGSGGAVPSSFVTGYKYAALGYTTALDAAISPLGARHAHEEFSDTPCLDKACLLLASDHAKVLEAAASGNSQLMQNVLAWLLASAKGWGIKAVNPGGVEAWKSRQHSAITGIDDVVQSHGVSPRQIVRALADAVDSLHLPHPLHIHCNHLGMPGNSDTTLATMQALEGRRGHFTHIQFHSYGGGNAEETTLCSDVARLVEYVRAHDNLTVDVGQVLFGKTVSMTGDSPAGHFLQKLYGTPWYSADVEVESGCGVAPIEYRETSLIHAWQWAIGLEWYLLMDDPWRIALSTDHPNGGSFAAYPLIIRLLMDRGFREETLQRIHPKVRERSLLRGLTREYSLEEIAIITRAAPARMLGLRNKGTLQVGADGDLVIYAPNANYEEMFSMPRFVIQAGNILVENGELRRCSPGKTLYTGVDWDPARAESLRAWFEKSYSISWDSFPVGEELSAELECQKIG